MWPAGPAATSGLSSGIRAEPRRLRKGCFIYKMNYGAIKKYDIANGEGIRVSLFVSGCTHRCRNCFNQEAWDFGYGLPFTKETEEEILQALAPDFISGLSLLGGEPFEPENQKELVKLVRRVKERYPGKDIWCYTGYTLERLLEKSRARCQVTDELLARIDVLVDGKFVEELKDISLPFRGSSNQRVIDVKASLAAGQAVSRKLYE